MPTYLVQKTLDGEPVAIFDESGESFHMPDFESLAKQGEASIQTKGTAVPWDVFVERKTDSVNHRFWWSSTVSSNPDIEEVLLNERARYRDG